MKGFLSMVLRNIFYLILAFFMLVTGIVSIITIYVGIFSWWVYPWTSSIIRIDATRFERYLNSPFIVNVLNLNVQSFSLGSSLLNSVVIGLYYLVLAIITFIAASLCYKAMNKFEELYWKTISKEHLEADDVSPEELERIKKKKQQEKDSVIQHALEMIFKKDYLP